MTADEAQANSDSITSTSFALHANRELTPLKSRLIVITPLREKILRTSVFIGCEILVEGVVLKANLIPLEMTDFNVILGMDWLSNHPASMNCFTKRIQFEKLGYPELEFMGDRRIYPLV